VVWWVLFEYSSFDHFLKISTLVERGRGVREGAGGPCFVLTSRKLSANASFFFSYKAMNDYHEIVKGTLASQREVHVNLNNTWLKVSNCRECLCKHLVKG